ncbi:MAG: LamG domain-containing protein [Patescibacteria group bacterium]|nr:LamG domain-containing protein [Patescibacteria group bacterium]
MEKPAGASGDYKDSTTNNSNSISTASQPSAAAGKIGNAQNFNNSYIQFDGSGSLNIYSSPITIEAWIKPTTLDATLRAVVDKGSATYLMGVSSYPSTGHANTFSISGSGGSGNYVAPQNSISTGVWYHLVVQGINNPKWYANGAYLGYYDTLMTLISNTDVLSIGDNSLHTRKFSGLIEEVRISNIARTPEWIKTEYNNQSAPSAFYAISASNASSRPADKPLIKTRSGVKFR